MPGTSVPIAKNRQRSAEAPPSTIVGSASTAPARNATAVTIAAPTTGSAPRTSAHCTATAIAPKSAPARRPRRTASTLD